MTNMVFPERTKYSGVAWHSIWETFDKDIITLLHYALQFQTADILTSNS